MYVFNVFSDSSKNMGFNSSISNIFPNFATLTFPQYTIEKLLSITFLCQATWWIYRSVRHYFHFGKPFWCAKLYVIDSSIECFIRPRDIAGAGETNISFCTKRPIQLSFCTGSY